MNQTRKPFDFVDYLKKGEILVYEIVYDPEYDPQRIDKQVGQPPQYTNLFTFTPMPMTVALRKLEKMFKVKGEIEVGENDGKQYGEIYQTPHRTIIFYEVEE